MGGKQTFGCYQLPVNEVAAFRRRFSALAGASAMAGAILMVATVTYPVAALPIALIAFPALAVGIWTLKCPHCGNRLVRNGASDIEWRHTGRWWAEPSRCKRCGNDL